MRFAGFGSVALGLTCALLVYYSPYKAYAGHTYKMVQHSVIINKPVHVVFRFMNDNSGTKNWITYVDHIQLLNKPGGKKGAHWRYYCNADETGQKFDGMLIHIKNNRSRKLKLFRFKDFPFEPGELIHEQLYCPLRGNRCKLFFTLYYNKKPGVYDDFKASIAAYKVKQALRENLNNIKVVLENRY